MNSVLQKSLEHMQLTFISLLLSMLIAIPLGIVLGRSKARWAPYILRCIAVIQTIPGLALIALMIVLLVGLQTYIPIPATGDLPAVFILALYALLPILSNTYTGMIQISPNVKNIANAMGMTKRQILFYIEIPLSLPILINGIRIALVSTIGMVTLTSLVGSGGLGDLIIQGLRTMQWGLVLSGTLPAALLAILFDYLLMVVCSCFTIEES